MPRETFETEIQGLKDEILILASMVENAIVKSVEYLKKRENQLASQLIKEDEVLNEKRYTIEADTVALIATQQPVASDLRTLIALLEIATELERIGDYAKGIAKVSLLIGEEPLMKPLVDLPRMAHIVQEMIHDAIQSFVDQDLELARAVPKRDDEIDDLYTQVYRELITYVIVTPQLIEQSNLLLWVAHNLERSADRAVNICERVVFTVTGELTELAPHSNEIVQGRLPR
jgi:phosphate transport system protein